MSKYVCVPKDRIKRLYVFPTTCFQKAREMYIQKNLFIKNIYNIQLTYVHSYNVIKMFQQYCI